MVDARAVADLVSVTVIEVAATTLPANAIFAFDDSPAKPTKSNTGADAAHSAHEQDADEANDLDKAVDTA